MVKTASVGTFSVWMSGVEAFLPPATAATPAPAAASTPTPSAPSSRPRRVMSVCAPSPTAGRGVPRPVGEPPEIPMPPRPGVPESGVGVAAPT